MLNIIYKQSMSEWIQFQRTPLREHEFKVPKELDYQFRHRSRLQQLYAQKQRWGQKEKEKQKDKQNPWDQIGKALTQRYNKKFLQLSLQMEKKQQQESENNETKIDGGTKEQKKTPKFQIKRKYLSFDYKGRESKQIKSHLKLTLGDDENERLIRNHSSTDSYSQKMKLHKKSNGKKLKELFVKDDDKVRTQQTALGTYFIANFSNHKNSPRQQKDRPNYKCIYIKKNRKKISLNPELQVSLKKTKPRRDTVEQQISNMRVRERIETDIPFSHRRRKQQNHEKDDEIHDKVFRPWSGYQSDDNL